MTSVEQATLLYVSLFRENCEGESLTCRIFLEEQVVEIVWCRQVESEVT